MVLGAGIGLVLIPAISLTLVSFDWNYVTVDESADTAPSSYWIQLYMVLFQIEVMDCLAVCDATFMLSYCGMMVYCMYTVNRGNNQKLAKMVDAGKSGCRCYRLKWGLEIITSCFCISLFIVFVMVLFQFGESGFFSPTNNVNAGFLGAWSLIVKIFIGWRIFGGAKDDKYHKMKRIFGSEDIDNDEILKAGNEENYAMETIQVTTTPETDNA